MSENKINISVEKIQYLTRLCLEENGFTVFDIMVDWDTNYYSEKTGGEEPISLVDFYDLSLDVEYNRPIDDFDTFIRNISKIFELLKHCATQFIITKDGNIYRGNENVDICVTTISKVEFDGSLQPRIKIIFQICL